MNQEHRWIVIAALIWLAAGPLIGFARAEDLQVNSYTTYEQSHPSVAADADGDFVVVWRSVGSSGTDSSRWSIQGQRYASNGSATGGQFQVNTYTTDRQGAPSVALDADGDFVVVWDSQGSADTDSSYRSIQGQRYASDGSTVGGEFQVNTYTTESQSASSVALDADGDFVVVWSSFGSGGSDSSSWSIQGQRYASDGSTAGGEFQVNTYTTNTQSDPSVALDADGDFVAVWESMGSAGTDSSDWSVQGQRYASDGSIAGGEFQVNTNTAGRQRFPSVALDVDGDSVVAWLQHAVDIRGQRFTPDGSAAGGEFQANTLADRVDDPSVALDADGDFVIAWTSDTSANTDSSDSSIQGQQFASDGVAVGDQFQVNTYTSGDQDQPSVALSADGDFIAAWTSDGSSGSDTSEGSIQASITTGDCTPDATTLCLPGDVTDQFEVSVYFETVQGGGVMGDAQALPLDSQGIDSGGIFAFSNLANPEFLVKVLNGCAINNHYWVFFAATTNVGFELTVTDTAAGQTQVFINPDLNPADAVTDTRAFATCPDGAMAGTAGTPDLATWYRGAVDAGSSARKAATTEPGKTALDFLGTCTPDAMTLCLPGDNRFEVSVFFETVQGGGRMGDAQAISLDPLGIDLGGIFYFQNPDNPEFLVKVLDGCAINNHYWVFFAATTNVGFELTVTDTAADQTQVFTNPDLNPANAVTDTQAFATCP